MCSLCRLACLSTGAVKVGARNEAPTDTPAGVSPEIVTALTTLDDRLAEVLRKGDIRLVRSAWVLKQDRDSFRMPHRQELEKMEKDGESPSPLLSTKEAEALLRRGQRAAGVLSQYVLSDRSNPGLAATSLSLCLSLSLSFPPSLPLMPLLLTTPRIRVQRVAIPW